MNKKELIIEEAKKEMARRKFWYYCKYFAGDYYKKDRNFLKDLCERLIKQLENALSEEA